MIRLVRPYVELSLLAGLVLCLNLGGAKLWDRDEPRNAGCAAEMLARGDWVVPVFDAELRTHKPVLLYWLIMASYSVLGINEWGARLPSALLAIGTVLCTYEMGRRLFSARSAWWAAAMLATSLLFVMAGRAATPDSTLIFFSTLSLTIYVVAVFPVRNEPGDTPATAANRVNECGENSGLLVTRWFPQRWVVAALIYGSMGMAVLAKGPVGCVLPTAVMGLFLCIMGRGVESGANSNPLLWRTSLQTISGWFAPLHVLRTAWMMRPVTAISAVVIVAAPWYVWVGLRTDGEFLRGFFLEHNLGRAMQTMEGHRGSIFFYPLAILVGTFPWSVFAAPVLLDLWRARRSGPWRPGHVFAIAWVAVYLTVFSFAKTKLPSYVTPCYPAVALLVGDFFHRWLAGDCLSARAWRYAAFSVLALVGMCILIAVPLAAQRVLPGEQWLGALGLVPLLAGIGGAWLLRRRLDAWSMRVFAGAGAAFVVLLFALGAGRVAAHQQYDRLWAAIRSTGAQNPRVAGFACLEPSWVFYSGWPVEELPRDSVSPAQLPWIEVNGRWVPKPKYNVSDFLGRSGTPFVLALGRDVEELQRQLPAGFQVLESVPLFLKDERLVLLGRIPAAPVARRGDEDLQR